MSRFSLILLLLLSGCQLVPVPPTSQVALGAGYYQLSDHWPGPAQQLLQHASWSDGQRQHQFTISALLQPDAMLLVALSPMGQELWRLQYQRGHQLSLSGIAPFSQPQFARVLLAQMQLALFEPQQLQGRLQQLTLQQDEQRRVLRDNQGMTVLQINQPGNIAAGQTLTIKTAAYHLQITTLQQDFLP
ncbi:MAG TPA: DUF3261 domain-containing protein [Rheinheimera sp.]|nr:DUF3261 domain-containing protein [Rheinheimera sp.]